MLPYTGIDSLDPQSSEISLFLLTSDIRVLHALFYGILSYRVNVLPSPKIPFGEFQDFLSSVSRCDSIN
jgi:hypothetical protein